MAALRSTVVWGAAATLLLAMCVCGALSNEELASVSVFGDAKAFLFGDSSAQIALMRSGKHNPYREFNLWINTLFFSYSRLDFVPPAVELALSKHAHGKEISYYLLCYIRDLFMGTAVYWLTAAFWHVVIYHIYGHSIFTAKGRAFPTAATIRGQMLLAQSSLFIYAMLPIVSEFLIESGLTKTYFYVEEIGGWGYYAGFLVSYIALVEIGIYWMHRTLHTNKFLYNYVHALHHQYKSAETLTPWASIAFNPLDGILQACPYVICLLFVPVHYFTHVFLLFFSGVWATNIHDSVVRTYSISSSSISIFFSHSKAQLPPSPLYDAQPGNSEPIMGAKYHTIHHTHFTCNYGQFIIFCDWCWGTLRLPKDKPSASFDNLAALKEDSKIKKER